MSDEKIPEQVKRLEPTKETLRELFLKSGNLCAFPGCNRPIMDQEARLVGQICHIEAAEEGGERFNKNQTNEARRAPSNLILLCYPHHVETNEVTKFDVKRMREMKANHEKKVFEFIEALQFRVVDQTKLSQAKPAVSLTRIARVLGWPLSPQELSDSATELNTLLNRLQHIPPPARTLLAVIVDKATASGHYDECVSYHEIELACGLTKDQASKLFQILDKYKLIREGGEDDYGYPTLSLCDLRSGWPIWRDLTAFVATGSATLDELVVNLNFSLLDENP